MAWLDDEAEIMPPIVSNYCFVDDKDELVSFHVLPKWNEGERQDGEKRVFLHGTADNGLQKIHKHVVAWKFDLSYEHPMISVLSKENNWLQLHKPRKIYVDTVMSILVTVQCLHYVKRNPVTSYESVQIHLSNIFGFSAVRRFQNDLVQHIPFISDSVKLDYALARSKFLVSFLGENGSKRTLSDEGVQATKNPRFVVGHVEDDMIDDAEDDSDDIDYLFNSVCAFCDDGGNLLGCEGRCLRSFHPTVESVMGFDCRSLGFTKDEVDAMPFFFCKNCKNKQHQCFACGKLGSSNKFSGAEVFPCVSPICGRFYHPLCVAKLLYRANGVSAEDLEKKIAIGESFICPIHKCCVCKQGEDRKDQDLQFAVCMRCPKSYHRKCLPRKHEILDDGRTVIRDHLKFPDVEVKKISVEENKSKLRPELFVERDEVRSKKKELTLKELYRITTAPAAAPSISKQKPSAVKVGGTNRNYVLSAFDTVRNRTMYTATEKELKTSVCEGNKTSLQRHEESSSKSNGNNGSQKSLGHGENRANETSRKLLPGDRPKHRARIGEISSRIKPNGGKLSANEKYKEMHPNTNPSDYANQHSELSSGTQFGTDNDGTYVNIPDDTSRRRAMTSVVPGSGETHEMLTGKYDTAGAQVRIYRQQDLDCVNSCPGSEAHSFSKTSAMVPYVPRLDQVNYSSSNALISDCPPMFCRNSYGPILEPQTGYLGGSTGFASGPNLNFSRHNSAGWLDE